MTPERRAVLKRHWGENVTATCPCGCVFRGSERDEENCREGHVDGQDKPVERMEDVILCLPSSLMVRVNEALNSILTLDKFVIIALEGLLTVNVALQKAVEDRKIYVAPPSKHQHSFDGVDDRCVCGEVRPQS